MTDMISHLCGDDIVRLKAQQISSENPRYPAAKCVEEAERQLQLERGGELILADSPQDTKEEKSNIPVGGGG